MNTEQKLKEFSAKYSIEKKRIEKIADSMSGAALLMKKYKDKYKESADHINDAIHQLSKLAAMGKAII